MVDVDEDDSYDAAVEPHPEKVINEVNDLFNSCRTVPLLTETLRKRLINHASSRGDDKKNDEVIHAKLTAHVEVLKSGDAPKENNEVLIDGRRMSLKHQHGRISLIAPQLSPDGSIKQKRGSLQKSPKKASIFGSKIQGRWAKIRKFQKVKKLLHDSGNDAKLYGLDHAINITHDKKKYERNIHSSEGVIPFYIIMPESMTKQWWDLVILFLLAYCVIVLPLRIAMNGSSTFLNKLDLVIDILFASDIVINFFSAYEDETSDIITNHKLIVKRYVSSWFFVDLLATFPFHLLFADLNGAARFTRLLRAPRLFRMFRILRLLKLLRVMKIAQVVRHLEDNSNVHPGVFRIVKLICWVLLVSHASACVWLAIPILEDPNSYEYSWLANSNEDYTDFTFQSKYLVAVYWAMTTLCTVGFGDIVPHSDIERVFTILTMILGVTFYAYSTATVSSVLRSLDLRETKNREKMEALRAFMKGVGLNPPLIKKLNNHFRYAWWQQHNMYDTQSLMESMPSHLRTEVALVLYKDLIGKTPYFVNKCSQFIAAVVTNVHPIRYSEKMYIGICGENVQDWYIIKSGVVECLMASSDNVLMTYVAGSTFGEIGILLTKKWETDVRAATHCEVLAMNRRNMFKVFSDYPDAREDLMEITGEKLNRLNVQLASLGENEITTGRLSTEDSPHGRKSSMPKFRDTNDSEGFSSQIFKELKDIHDAANRKHGKTKERSSKQKSSIKTSSFLGVQDLGNPDASSESFDTQLPMPPKTDDHPDRELINNRIIDLESNLKNIVDVCNELMQKVDKL